MLKKLVLTDLTKIRLVPLSKLFLHIQVRSKLKVGANPVPLFKAYIMSIFAKKEHL